MESTRATAKVSGVKNSNGKLEKNFFIGGNFFKFLFQDSLQFNCIEGSERIEEGSELGKDEVLKKVELSFPGKVFQALMFVSFAEEVS